MTVSLYNTVWFRWSGTYNMLDHYLKIRPYLNSGIWPDLVPILILIPTLAEDARLRDIFNDLKQFESVSKGLQKADSTLFAARTGFSWLLEAHPHLSPKLGVEFSDLRWRAFESAVYKVRSPCYDIRNYLLI
jgi:hypothetical protein